MRSGSTAKSASIDEQEKLLASASAAAQTAYAPYSEFRVGAAVLAGGKIYAGCNVENASYGLTVCAERVAIFNAISAGHRNIDMIAISCPDARPDSSPSACMPCGACRQVMAEFAARDMSIIVERVGKFCLTDLLPEPFVL